MREKQAVIEEQHQQHARFAGIEWNHADPTGQSGRYDNLLGRIMEGWFEGAEAPPELAGSGMSGDQGCAEGAHKIERPVGRNDRIHVGIRILVEPCHQKMACPGIVANQFQPGMPSAATQLVQRPQEGPARHYDYPLPHSPRHKRGKIPSKQTPVTRWPANSPPIARYVEKRALATDIRRFAENLQKLNRSNVGIYKRENARAGLRNSEVTVSGSLLGSQFPEPHPDQD